MLSTLKSYALEGINGYLVEIEVYAQSGIPSFDIVGLAGSSIKESRDRVLSAIKTALMNFCPKSPSISPRRHQKEGSGFDLPIALGFLLSTQQVVTSYPLQEFIILGELSLDGSLKRLNGVMPLIISAMQAGYKKFIVPKANAKEAAYIKGVEIYAFDSLSDTVNFFWEYTPPNPLSRLSMSKATT